MTEYRNSIVLNDKVPIRLISQPFCKKCMNKLDKSEDYCTFCLEKPHPSESDWFFNRNISLGIYQTYPNEEYNKVPLNIISRMILILKGNVKKPKEGIGVLFSDGLFKMIKKYSFLLGDKTFLVLPPKNNISEENQCVYFLKPLMNILAENGYYYENISHKLKRIRDIGKNKEKNRDQRFSEIRGVHQLEEMDLMGKKVLILDDVITTASTIWDISRELKEKNAGEINVLSLGRALIGDGNVMEDDIPSDLSFDELLIYFSNLNIILDPKNIKNVVIKDISIDDLCLNCRSNDYRIEIDFKNRVLKHNCIDFNQRRYRSKTFCKHITMFFLDLKVKHGEKFAKEKLYNIYKNLIHWHFVSKEV